VLAELFKDATLLNGKLRLRHLVRKNAHSSKPVEFYDFVEKLCPARATQICSRAISTTTSGTVTATKRRGRAVQSS
jgi:N6-adenosine-specific RNA methylase IME4